MISMEMINEKWSSIKPRGNNEVFRRVDPDHPLDFFIGYDIYGHMQLMLVSDYFIDLPQSTQQVTVRGNQREDKKYAICFILKSISLKETFVSLCLDIIISTYGIKEQVDGVKATVKRFTMWLALMAKGVAKKLSENELKGLLGELIVLKNICIPKYGNKAVLGWLGPLYGDRDFEYNDNWIEVKAVSSKKSKVQISSFEQLDHDNQGELIICRIDKSVETDMSAISLHDIINDITIHLGSEVAAIFHIRLMLTGYDTSDERIYERYHLFDIERYQVAEDFPRLRKSQMRKEILNGGYSLDIMALSEWRS